MEGLDGTVMTWNSAAERLFGFPSDEIVGRPIARLLPPARAREAAPTMLLGQGLLTAACVFLGLFPTVFLRLLDPVTSQITGDEISGKLSAANGLVLSGGVPDGGTVWPLGIAALGVCLLSVPFLRCTYRAASSPPSAESLAASPPGELTNSNPAPVENVASNDPDGVRRTKPRDAPPTMACRRLDWDNLVQHLDAVTKAILEALTVGHELTRLVKRFRRSRSSIQIHKNRLARLIKEHLGDDILRQVQEQPGWHNDVQAIREKLACRWERSTT